MSNLAVFFFQAEDGIRDYKVTGVQTCALPISVRFVATRCRPMIGAMLCRCMIGMRVTMLHLRWRSVHVRISARDTLRRSEEHTSELQSPCNLVCRLLLEKKTQSSALLHQPI